MATYIPHDLLLHHVLPWLSTRSVARFKCVAKEFRSYLSSKNFRSIHNRYIDYHQNHIKFLVLDADTVPQFKLGIINCKKSDKVLTPVSFKPPKTNGISKIKFLTSFHGLVCLCVSWNDRKGNGYSDFVLWNPVTSEYKTMSKPKSRITRLDMYYNSCEDDYKLVSVIRRDYFHIYSLKSDSWKTIGFEGTYDLEADRLSTGICLNEYLYFVDYNEKCSVTRFDTKTETFTEMQGAPDFSDGLSESHLALMVKNGCIHVCIMYIVKSFSEYIHLTECWKINEEGNWKKMETYRLCMLALEPLHWMRNGNFLMLGCNLYNVHLKKNTVKKNKPCKGTGKEKQLLPVANMHISQIVRYNETFVSPNQYSK